MPWNSCRLCVVADESGRAYRAIVASRSFAFMASTRRRRTASTSPRSRLEGAATAGAEGGAMSMPASSASAVSRMQQTRAGFRKVMTRLL